MAGQPSGGLRASLKRDLARMVFSMNVEVIERRIVRAIAAGIVYSLLWRPSPG